MNLNFRIPNIVKKILPWGDSFFFETWSYNTNYNKDAKKLRTVLENPAALFIILLLCDLFSMGQYKLYKKGEEKGEPIEDHPLLQVLRNPNPMQTEEQFKWDHMFWRVLGVANMLSDSKVLKGPGSNVLYWLSPDLIKWPKWFADNNKTLFFSRQSITELGEKELTYESESQKYPFKYKFLKRFFDLSNGINGWFEIPSRLDALYKIVKNSDNALDSKNINSHLARKFLVSGKHDPSNVATLPMARTEKDDIEKKVLSRKNVHAMRSMVDIKRFLEDLGALAKLDTSFLNDAFLIGKMYNIPRDVIERFDQGATYENQEKARAAVISYCIQPAADDFCAGLLDFFGVTDLTLMLSYDHLPFVQTFEKERAETDERRAMAFFRLVSAGADQKEAAELLGLDLNSFTEPRQMNAGQNSGSNNTSTGSNSTSNGQNSGSNSTSTGQQEEEDPEKGKKFKRVA